MEKYEEIIQRIWTDEDFKQRLMSEPKAVFSELGVDFEESVRLEVHNDTVDTAHYVLLSSNQVQEVHLNPASAVGKVTKRAFEDPEFKSRLLSDPKPAIQEVLGIEPQGNVVICENTEDHIHIILPNNPNTTGELSDTDLSMVAGGKLLDGLVELVGETTDALTGGLVDGAVEGTVHTFSVATFGANYTKGVDKLMNLLTIGFRAFQRAARNP